MLILVVMATSNTKWLNWAREIQALSQTSLTYAENHFQVARYERLREIAAEMLATPDAPPEHILKLFKNEAGYATPKVDVRAAIFEGDKILLVQERSDEKWSLPGGWADVSQSPSECIIREVWEECGLHARITKLAAVFDREKHPHEPHFPFHIYKMFFMCAVTGGTITPSNETLGAAYFAEDDLPPLSIDRIVEFQVKAMFRHHREPNRPADFD